ncbi:uncharacterized protein [Antedon mediterranea]|uniref:uncharacterized protein n=1 Tax=Antedon mediterranea TaxID=105859 RepID=UPI003AF4637C
MPSVKKIRLLWVCSLILTMQTGKCQLAQSNIETDFNETLYYDHLNYQKDQAEILKDDLNYTEIHQNDNVHSIKLFSSTGYFLRIGPDGRVTGTRNCRDNHVRLAVSVVGPNLFVIKGLGTNRYLSMNTNGRISVRENAPHVTLNQNNFDILWREYHIEHSCFRLYQSFEQFRVGIAYSNMRKANISNSTSSMKPARFLAIKRNGRVMSSSRKGIYNGIYRFPCC